MCLFLIVDHVVKRSCIVLYCVGKAKGVRFSQRRKGVFVLFFFNLFFSDVPCFKIK